MLFRWNIHEGHVVSAGLIVLSPQKNRKRTLERTAGTEGGGAEAGGTRWPVPCLDYYIHPSLGLRACAHRQPP